MSTKTYSIKEPCTIEVVDTVKTLIAFYSGIRPGAVFDSGKLTLSWASWNNLEPFKATFSLESLLSGVPELSTIFEHLFSSKSSNINGKQLQAELHHWHRPGIQFKQEDAWRIYIADVVSIDDINVTNKTLTVSGFIYKVMENLNYGGINEQKVLRLPDWKQLRFGQLEHVYPGASEKLVVGKGVGLTNKELFDYVTAGVANNNVTDSLEMPSEI